MRLLVAAFAAISMCLSVGQKAVAQQGPYFEYWVQGSPLRCTVNGRRIPIYISSGLGDLAIARIFPDGRYYIAIDDVQMRQLDPIVQVFVFAHECAHHKGPTMGESWADCMAARELRRLGYVTNFGQVATIMRAFANSPPSSAGHLPGPYRAELIRQCSA